MNPAGYTGTPLAKKLGIKQGHTLKLVNEPPHYFDLFADFPTDVTATRSKSGKKNFIHYFETQAVHLEKNIVALKRELEQDGMLWVSWYKKAAKMPSDVSEDLIRKIALKHGLVDVKVCAVDEQWSGLKLVIPVKYRR